MDDTSSSARSLFVVQTPSDVVNLVLDPVHVHVQIPTLVGRSGGVTRDFVEKRA
jgi:hypothetical protein